MSQELRPYQRETLEERLPHAFKRGHKRICLVGPCGCGKTTLISKLCQGAASKGKTVTVTAHRRRLIKQLSERLQAFGVRYTVAMADLPDEPWAVEDIGADVIIGSRDTMLARLATGEVRSTALWIPDEAHTIVGRGYKELGERIDPEFVIGPTATPCLSNGMGFGRNLFDALVPVTTIEHLIAQRYLVPVDAYCPVGAARRKVKDIKAGIYGDPVQQWIKHAEGLRTITFCRTLAECRAVYLMFNREMIPAEILDADTPDELRDEAIERLSKGETKVIVCTPGLMGVGVDIPALECVQTLVKNISPIPFWQTVGREQRIAPGKERAVLLDHSAAVYEHGMPNVSPLWELGTQDSVQLRQLRRMDEKADVRPVVCRACGYIFAGDTCPQCQTLAAKSGRDPATQRENLEQVDNVPAVNRLQDDWRKFLRICAAKGWKVSRALEMFRGKRGVYPDHAGLKITPPVYWSKRYQLVAVVYPEYAPK